MRLWWKLVAWFKRFSVSGNIENINNTYQSLIDNGGKVSLIDKATQKTKKEYEQNKKAFLEYTSFCIEKELLLPERDQDTLSVIEFDKQIKKISVQREKFNDTLEFGKQQKKALENSIKGSGAGVAAGAAVVSMAPTAALWVATTFGTASTGTAISALSGAAATNAALAWLGGGALVAGGHGMAAGNALLALAGPVGWGIAGGSVIAGVLLLWRKKLKIKENMKKEIERMKNCTERLRELKAEIEAMKIKTSELNFNVNKSASKLNYLANGNYKSFSEEEQYNLGSLVNTTNALSELLNTVVSE